ncbi:MAG: hypothetical protein ACR2JT_00075, partial [Nocardioidaceae bacterium]
VSVCCTCSGADAGEDCFRAMGGVAVGAWNNTRPRPALSFDIESFDTGASDASGDAAAAAFLAAGRRRAVLVTPSVSAAGAACDAGSVAAPDSVGDFLAADVFVVPLRVLFLAGGGSEDVASELLGISVDTAGGPAGREAARRRPLGAKAAGAAAVGASVVVVGAGSEAGRSPGVLSSSMQSPSPPGASATRGHVVSPGDRSRGEHKPAGTADAPRLPAGKPRACRGHRHQE